MRKAYVAAILSFLFVGLGQIYNNRLKKAVVFIVMLAASSVIGGYLLCALIWLIAVADAYLDADEAEYPEKYGGISR
ncbi:MAG TPA: hypothetical protein PLQ01_05080 [Methanothrix sp.]|nr:hypothetical protein [Methanothrix sp.]